MLGLICLQVLLVLLVAMKYLFHTTGCRTIKLEVVFEVQKMARYASFCFIVGPFNHLTACMLDFSSTHGNTARLVPELSGTFVLHIVHPLACSRLYCRAWCKQLVWLCLGYITGFVLLQHDNCYYSGRGLPWATVYIN